jgi:CubicO group peptidase (beta-lactamase class C family)
MPAGVVVFEPVKRVSSTWFLLSLLGAGAALAGTPSVSASAPVASGEVATALRTPIRDAVDAVLRVPGGAPAMAAVIVQGDATPWIHMGGSARANAVVPVDADTRFYIASQTKSFMGLLGAMLDARGEFPLSTTLADVWPELRLPPPADPRPITMADLLSHQEGLSTSTLNVVTAYVRDVPAAEYPALLASEVTPREAGFRYANIGDLIYGAALEASTGRNWRAWLDGALLGPLALEGISPRTSTVTAAHLTWNHQWDGTQWRVLPPKPDALMHAAGGLVASPRAMARWMQLNLGIVDPNGVFTAAALQRSQRPIAKSNLADGEIDCNGYSLGWYSCTYRGQQALLHPGSYNGAVSVTVLVPSARAGLSLMANSDSAMEGLMLEVLKSFIGLATEQPGEDQRLRKALEGYPAKVQARAAGRRADAEAARADPQWGGWTWRPDATALGRCTGQFRNPLYGTMRVHRDGPGLNAQVGALQLELEPAQPAVFAASTDILEAPEPLRCDADAGQISWRGQVFRK